jgi:hypothetical protein
VNWSPTAEIELPPNSSVKLRFLKIETGDWAGMFIGISRTHEIAPVER